MDDDGVRFHPFIGYLKIIVPIQSRLEGIIAFHGNIFHSHVMIIFFKLNIFMKNNCTFIEM